jgi:hypothetical protein
VLCSYHNIFFRLFSSKSPLSFGECGAVFQDTIEHYAAELAAIQRLHTNFLGKDSNFILDLILASKIAPKYHSFKQQKRARKIPGSFSRSVGTAKLKGLQVRILLVFIF